MKKIRKKWKAVSALMRNPWLLNRVLEEESLWVASMRKKGFSENGLPVVSWETLFPEFSETIETFAFLDGGSLPTDIALLKGLARKFSSCNYFEIGTWRGESVANVADVPGARCTTLNLSGQEMMRQGASGKYAAMQGLFSKGRSNIRHVEGNTLTFDFGGLGQKFDLIFIDGDHHFETVKSDTEKVFEHLVHENSMVVWHDYGHNPEKVRWEVFAALWEGTPPEKRNHLVHVENTLCAVYLPEKPAKTQSLETPVVPHHKFQLKLSIRKL